MASKPSGVLGPLGVGEGLVGLGAVAIVVSIFLRWIDFSHSIAGSQLTQRFKASRVPVRFLWDYTATNVNVSLLIVLIPIAALCVAGMLLRHARWLGALGGVLALGVGLLFIYQLHQRLRTAHLPGFGLSDFLGIASIICIIGGALALVGGGLGLLRSSRAT